MCNSPGYGLIDILSFSREESQMQLFHVHSSPEAQFLRFLSVNRSLTVLDLFRYRLYDRDKNMLFKLALRSKRSFIDNSVSLICSSCIVCFWMADLKALEVNYQLNVKEESNEEKEEREIVFFGAYPRSRFLQIYRSTSIVVCLLCYYAVFPEIILYIHFIMSLFQLF